MTQKTLDWTLLRSFLAISTHGSLSQAAHALGITQPTVGRHLDELEAHLRVRLFVRSARGLAPTDFAFDLLPYAKSMAASIAAVERTATGESDDEQGTVRLTASEVIGAEVLPPMLTAFRHIHPRIAIELVLSNRNEDLLHREADIAVRMIRPTQQQLVARKIGDVPVYLFAHKSYAQRRGLPKSLADLTTHDIIGYDAQTTVLNALSMLGMPVTREAFTIRTDNDLAQIALLRAGAGIGGLQKQIAVREKNLVPVLHAAVSLPLEMWLVMHEDLRASRRVRLLYDFLRAALAEHVKPTKRR